MYAKVVDNQISKYPYSFIDLKKDNANTSFPSNAMEQSYIQESYGFVPVVGSPPVAPKGFKVVEENPNWDGSVCTGDWKIVPKDKNALSSSDITPTPEPVEDGKLAVEGDPELVGNEWKQTWSLVDKSWIDNRADAYGSAFEQIEFITENGLESWQTKVSEIKAKYPKP